MLHTNDRQLGLGGLKQEGRRRNLVKNRVSVDKMITTFLLLQ